MFFLFILIITFFFHSIEFLNFGIVHSIVIEYGDFRRDRLDEHRRERNIARNNPDKLERLKRGKERDISEKIALGLPDSRARNGDTQFDQRLFDQTKVGGAVLLSLSFPLSVCRR